MTIEIPELCLVVLVGSTGSGKSTFARRHFLPTEVISSDHCRGLVADDENDQSATSDAFEILRFIASKRLARGRLTVIDATNVQREARGPLVQLAREHDVLPVAIVLDLPAELCHERNRDRADRTFGPHVARQHAQQLRRSLRSLKREGFRSITVLDSPEAVANTTIERRPLWSNKKEETGPFDIIGDVHGCYDELVELLAKLGYGVSPETLEVAPPEGRRAIFLGDLVDRGPDSPGVLRLVMAMARAGVAFCVPGNHEQKLKRKLSGKDVRLTHGLAETLEQMAKEPADFASEVEGFIDSLVSHLVLDGGRLVVAHAGMKEAFQGRASARVREFALYGETTGETDSFGLPVRYDWAADYRGGAMVVYGHTPVPTAEWVNRTICVDTGCVFGGHLTALRYPEKELVQVPARKIYYEPAKPFDAVATDRGERGGRDVLDISDVRGKRVVETRVRGNVTIREENGAAALEVMSRFAVDPRWLIYLPPTMSPPETHRDGELLEHPEECFAYYRANGVPRVVCEEKHMGSRAVLVVCRSEEVAEKRFGIAGDGMGEIYTRTGRAFFPEGRERAAVLERLRDAITESGLWDALETDWLCLDAEIMPWSAKARELLRAQYAPVGTASRAGLRAASEALRSALGRGAAAATATAIEGVEALLARVEDRRDCAERYTRAYRRFCWTVSGIEDLRVAPFHILASENRTFVDRDHAWHMETLSKLVAGGAPLLHPTDVTIVDVTDPKSREEGVRWWEMLTARDGEGMVVKPLDWMARGQKGLVQPAMKCRGREYLRIIYGPEYTLPAHLERLRSRHVGTKRSLALREYALGLEALHRFVEKEPLYRVHECVFGVLALESEPVDPRL